ncbi:MAG: phage head morphogenesis protein [Spirochaetota bacterium]|nr:phage head morphogenesis protein [Spirochaetota bacterium]
MPLSKKQIEKLLKGIHSGEISVFNLPEDVFKYTFVELINSVDTGFGGSVTKFPKGSIRAIRAMDYRQNILEFSGAKTFNNVKDLTLFVFKEDGTKRSFKEFREAALKINDQYNVNYLKTEQDTAFGMAQGSDKWMSIEEDKEIFPMLKYETAGDDRVRDEHRDWDQLMFPVDHEFWNTRMPPNSYNCRCIVTQHTEGKTSSLKERLESVNKERKVKELPLIKNLDNSDKMFSVNPGEVNYIFNKDAHPYFKVEKRFKPMMDDNFGFKMPEI